MKKTTTTETMSKFTCKECGNVFFVKGHAFPTCECGNKSEEGYIIEDVTLDDVISIRFSDLDFDCIPAIKEEKKADVKSMTWHMALEYAMNAVSMKISAKEKLQENEEDTATKEAREKEIASLNNDKVILAYIKGKDYPLSEEEHTYASENRTIRALACELANHGYDIENVKPVVKLMKSWYDLYTSKGAKQDVIKEKTVELFTEINKVTSLLCIQADDFFNSFNIKLKGREKDMLLRFFYTGTRNNKGKMEKSYASEKRLNAEFRRMYIGKLQGLAYAYADSTAPVVVDK